MELCFLVKKLTHATIKGQEQTQQETRASEDKGKRRETKGGNQQETRGNEPRTEGQREGGKTRARTE